MSQCKGATVVPQVPQFLVEVSSHGPLPQLCKKRSCSILPTSTAVACPRNLKHPILRMFERNVASLMNVYLPETNVSFREGSPVNFSNLKKNFCSFQIDVSQCHTVMITVVHKHLRLESFRLSLKSKCKTAKYLPNSQIARSSHENYRPVQVTQPTEAQPGTIAPEAKQIPKSRRRLTKKTRPEESVLQEGPAFVSQNSQNSSQHHETAQASFPMTGHELSSVRWKRGIG